MCVIAYSLLGACPWCIAVEAACLPETAMLAANVPITRLLTEERIVGVIDLHTTETVYHRGDDYLSVDCSRVEAWPAEACGGWTQTMPGHALGHRLEPLGKPVSAGPHNGPENGRHATGT